MSDEKIIYNPTDVDNRDVMERVVDVYVETACYMELIGYDDDIDAFAESVGPEYGKEISVEFNPIDDSIKSCFIFTEDPKLCDIIENEYGLNQIANYTLKNVTMRKYEVYDPEKFFKAVGEDYHPEEWYERDYK